VKANQWSTTCHADLSRRSFSEDGNDCEGGSTSGKLPAFSLPRAKLRLKKAATSYEVAG
jgi:hypothetical protein